MTMKKERRSNFKDKIGRDIQRRKEARKSFGYLNLPDGIRMLSFEEGTTKVHLDIIPYEVTDPHHPDKDGDTAAQGTLWWKRPFKVHRNVGEDNATMICPTSVGKKCPICEERVRMIKAGTDKEIYKQLYPKERTLYIVIPLDVPKHEAVPHIWDMSDYLFQEKLDLAIEEELENSVFPDLEVGKTLFLRLKWKELGENKYPEVREDITFKDREPYDESILEEVPNLDEVLKVPSYNEVLAKFAGVEAEEDGGELIEEDEAPAPRARKRAVPESKSEEEEEEEELPQKPARKAITTNVPPRRKPVAEPEPEEEEDDLDEPQEAPPVRRARPVTEKSVSSKDKCPYGHKFGIDTDKFKDCEKCDIWDECMDEKERA